MTAKPLIVPLEHHSQSNIRRHTITFLQRRKASFLIEINIIRACNII